jgi:hypothetical protein
VDQAALQALVDKQAIYDVMMQWCRGVDRCDDELMRMAYHEDAVDHHGTWVGSASDFVTWFVGASRDLSPWVMHHVSNVTIELNGDVASAESYFLAVVGRVEDGVEYVDTMGGRYLDDWERRDGKWKMTARVVVHDWDRANAFGTEQTQFNSDGLLHGSRNREDLSFRAFDAPGTIAAMLGIGA